LLDSPKKKAIPAKGGAGGGAISGNSDQADRDLAMIVSRWPTLPHAIRTAILKMVRGEVSN
jgi:hypothetical protein